jgi:lipoprotein-anchoring transpeptidase ErfK/SrfK
VNPSKIRAPSRKAGSWIAKIIVRTAVRSKPGGGRKVWRAKPQTEFNHQGQRLMVLGHRRAPNGKHWLRVRLPIRPNDTTGWIPLDRVLVMKTRYWMTVDVSQRRVSVYNRGRRKRQAKAVVGVPSTPTPRGLFAVYETVKQRDPNAFLGTYALHLTSHSDVLQNFGGGDGRVAIHGRGGSSFNDPLGTAASHGCIRVNNSFINWVQRVAEAGTPVRIVG